MVRRCDKISIFRTFQNTKISTQYLFCLLFQLKVIYYWYLQAKLPYCRATEIREDVLGFICIHRRLPFGRQDDNKKPVWKTLDGD